MKIIIQPDDGIEPILSAIEQAKTSIDIVVFRLDVKAILDALQAAVARGVAVRALVAHTNKGDEKGLRKLEVQMLGAGVTVSRTADDLVRYHGKMMIIDGRKLHVHGFNFTWKDIGKSRSFGAVTTAPTLVREAVTLFRADADRQPYAEGCDRFLVSPVNSRSRLMAFIAGARRQLCIYDEGVTDQRMVRLLAERRREGVDVRIIGAVSAASTLEAEKYPGTNLHVRAIIRDRTQAFLGSQSLRALELDRRREIGLIIRERPAVRRMLETFEADWALTAAGRKFTDASTPGATGSDTVMVVPPGGEDAVLATRQAEEARAAAVQATSLALDAAREAVAGESDSASESARQAAAEAKAAAKEAKAAAKDAIKEADAAEGEARRVAREAAKQAKAAALEAKAAARAAKEAARLATDAVTD